MILTVSCLITGKGKHSQSSTKAWCVQIPMLHEVVNPLSTNPIKWSNTLKQFVSKLQTNCLSLFDHFVELVLKGLRVYGVPSVGKFKKPFLNFELGDCQTEYINSTIRIPFSLT